jgi:antitoxin component YwqK of YwqJK toxin-antitoxin module
MAWPTTSWIDVEPIITEQMRKVYKSSLGEQTKEFVLFVLAQLASLDEGNGKKLLANAQKGTVEKLKAWHENESIYYEMPIKLGKRNGLFMMWQPNGKLLCEVPFEDGKINGIAVFRKASGDEKVVFENDTPISLDK